MTAPPIRLDASIPTLADSALLLQPSTLLLQPGALPLQPPVPRIHPPGLFLHPSGLLLTVAVTLALALVGTLTPLRGGHGQHADSGPGALTVVQLLTQHTSPENRTPHRTGKTTTVDAPTSATTRNPPPPPGSVLCPPPGSPLETATIVFHGPDRSPDSDWWDALGHRPDPNPTPAERRALLNHPEYQPPNASRQRPHHPTSLAEEDLARLLELPEESRRGLTAQPTHDERPRLLAA
ncbi:hypothetical protein SAMN04487820_10681 [Actinopolyspora mzabensis]|uniref:Uncharacterized protein n=1 Tax=Actinopolyspora mzabensis TaxID=995066 RepID=A0A1G9AJ48_ACTMZ|nr:hypothetical protein [Actinopolyspora mzabensis]SDK27347.1 hypothetical protein SAMN04487820_10681 [Actinopolyspora mzabensis]